MLKNEILMFKFVSIGLTTFIVSLNDLGIRTQDGGLIKANIINSKF